MYMKSVGSNQKQKNIFIKLFAERRAMHVFSVIGSADLDLDITEHRRSNITDEDGVSGHKGIAVYRVKSLSAILRHGIC